MRPSTAVKTKKPSHLSSTDNRSAKPKSFREHADRIYTVSDTWDSRHMDRFLKRHESEAVKTEIGTHLPSYYHNDQFRTSSKILPCDWTDTNHFGREGREDLRAADYEP
jgi:hypothetical protein